MTQRTAQTHKPKEVRQRRDETSTTSKKEKGKKAKTVQEQQEPKLKSSKEERTSSLPKQETNEKVEKETEKNKEKGKVKASQRPGRKSMTVQDMRNAGLEKGLRKEAFKELSTSPRKPHLDDIEVPKSQSSKKKERPGSKEKDIKSSRMKESKKSTNKVSDTAMPSKKGSNTSTSPQKSSDRTLSDSEYSDPPPSYEQVLREKEKTGEPSPRSKATALTAPITPTASSMPVDVNKVSIASPASTTSTALTASLTSIVSDEPAIASQLSITLKGRPSPNKVKGAGRRPPTNARAILEKPSLEQSKPNLIENSPVIAPTGPLNQSAALSSSKGSRLLMTELNGKLQKRGDSSSSSMPLITKPSESSEPVYKLPSSSSTSQHLKDKNESEEVSSKSNKVQQSSLFSKPSATQVHSLNRSATANMKIEEQGRAGGRPLPPPRHTRTTSDKGGQPIGMNDAGVSSTRPQPETTLSKNSSPPSINSKTPGPQTSSSVSKSTTPGSSSGDNSAQTPTSLRPSTSTSSVQELRKRFNKQ